MRTLSLALAVAALVGVAWLLSTGERPDHEGDDSEPVAMRVSALEVQLQQLTSDVARLIRLREEEGPRLLRAGPSEDRGLAALRLEIAALVARQSEAQARLDKHEARLPPARPTEGGKKAPSDPTVVDGWMAKLEDADEDLVFSATIELAKLGDLRAADPLMRVLRDHKDFYARLGAGTALGTLRATAAVPALIEALGDKDELVRTACAEALWNITKHSIKSIAGLDSAGRESIQRSWRDWWYENAAAVRERLDQSR